MGKLILGETDLWSTHPEIAKQLKDKEIGYTLKAGSNKEVIFVCPICNTEVKARVNRWINGEKKCTKCNDKIPYPEKFIFNLLEQLLKSDFDYQTIYTWAKNKKYDFSLFNKTCIIETHGNQHYDENTMFSDSLNEVQKNDKLKEQLAKENGIQHYIVLDCRKSELEWIKKSVMESELPILLNFKEDDIDWNECHKNSLKSFVYKSCELWNANNYSVVDIAKMLKVSTPTVRKYLKNGAVLGICNYNPNEEIEKKNTNLMISIVCLNNSQIYNSVTEASKLFNITKGMICACCKGKQKYTTNKKTGEQLTWMYYDEYLKRKECV